MNTLDFIFSIVILIMSVVIHEVSHGLVAQSMGDQTAERQGRLTLNPLVHLDIFGSIILPVLSYFFGGFIIGWAKPVPYNPYNLDDQRWGEAKVALAGPASNFILALVFGIALRSWGVSLGAGFADIASTIVAINLILGTFNLVPIPPLDGSKVLFSLFPDHLMSLRRGIEQYGLIIVILFIFFLWQFLLPIVGWEYHLITGLTF